MRTILLLLAAVLTLAACGANAPPFPPKREKTDTPPTGVVVSGEARIGVTGTF